MAAGSLSAGEAGRTHRPVVALALPTRAFAATLAAAGAAVSTAADNIHTTRADYFRCLCSLPSGTPVSLLVGSRMKVGQLHGRTIHDGIPFLAVKVEEGHHTSLKHLVPESESFHVQLRDTDVELRARQRGRTVRGEAAFLENLAGHDTATVLLTVSSGSVQIVGQRSRIEHDADAFGLVVRPGPGEGRLSARLGDIARVKQLLPPGAPYRTAIVSPSRRPSAGEVGLGQPHVVVFDGARAFLNRRDGHGDAAWVVCLDRTEPSFQDAVEVVNQIFTSRGRAMHVDPTLKQAPPGVEAMFFGEELKCS